MTRRAEQDYISLLITATFYPSANAMEMQFSPKPPLWFTAFGAAAFLYEIQLPIQRRSCIAIRTKWTRRLFGLHGREPFQVEVGRLLAAPFQRRNQREPPFLKPANNLSELSLCLQHESGTLHPNLPVCRCGNYGNIFSSLY